MKHLILLILVFTALAGYSQQELRGIIFNDKNTPLEQVQVTEFGTTNTVYTNQEGVFKITFKEITNLLIKAKGYSSLDLSFNIDNEIEKKMLEANGDVITTLHLKLFNGSPLSCEAQISFKPKHPIKHPYLKEQEARMTASNYVTIIDQYKTDPAAALIYLVPINVENDTSGSIMSPNSSGTVYPQPTQERVTKQYVIEPASARLVDVPATYETVTEQAAVTPASATFFTTTDEDGIETTTISPSPQQCETVTKKVLKEPAYTKVVHTPAVYTPKQVVVSSPDMSSYEKKSQIVVSSTKPATSRKKVRNKPANTIVPTKTPAVKQFLATTASTSQAKQTPRPTRRQRPQPKLLTATEINDFSKWKFWEDITENILKEYTETWKMNTKQRYCVLVKTENGSPLIGGLVNLLDSDDQILWTAQTDNTGKAELWGSLFQPESKGKRIEVVVDGKSFYKEKIKTFHKEINVIELPIACKEEEKAIDIAFIVDATASMGDELNYVKAELLSIVNQTKEALPDYSLNLGSVFYYDEDTPGDLMYTKDFTANVHEMNRFINQRTTKMGSNFPEALDHGLQQAMRLNWRDGATTKLLFLILDAPPHTNEEYYNRFQTAVRTAAAKGIRIIPVGCSGTHKTTEFLMRAVALATNGTYIHLTDESGIGKAHTRPTTAKINNESLNQIIIRQITAFSKIEECTPNLEEEIATLEAEELPIEENHVRRQNLPQIDWLIYPNPTAGRLQVSASAPINQIHVLDNNGKLLKRVLPMNKTLAKLNIGEFTDAVYLIRVFFEDGTQKTGKVILLSD